MDTTLASCGTAHPPADQSLILQYLNPILSIAILLQRRLGLTLSTHTHHTLRALLHQALLSLRLHERLLLAERQRVRDAQQQHGTDHDPHALAAISESSRNGRGSV